MRTRPVKNVVPITSCEIQFASLHGVNTNLLYQCSMFVAGTYHMASVANVIRALIRLFKNTFIVSRIPKQNIVDKLLGFSYCMQQPTLLTSYIERYALQLKLP